MSSKKHKRLITEKYLNWYRYRWSNKWLISYRFTRKDTNKIVYTVIRGLWEID